MDINSAQKNVEKLLKYVQNLADTNPIMYSKSKEKLKDVASTCNKVIQCIAEILQEEALQEDATEFQSSSDLSDVLDSMQTQITQLRQFVGVQDPAVPGVISNSSENRRTVIQDMKVCLHQLSTVHTGISVVDGCGQLLWDWFNVRFIQTARDSEFKYNLKRVKSWIRDIVILYGLAVHTDTLPKFMQDFHDWIHKLTADTNKFAVPYDVYIFNRYQDPMKLTLESLIIWDMLIDAGLNEICKSSEYYLDNDAVYELCEVICPHCLNDYRYYKDSPDMLRLLERKEIK